MGSTVNGSAPRRMSTRGAGRRGSHSRARPSRAVLRGLSRTEHWPSPAYVDFYAGGRLGMGSTVNGSAPRRMST